MVTGYALLIVFVLSVAILLLSIIKFKLNPFIALIGTSIITGFLVKMPIVQIPDTIATGFGNTLKGVGIVIGLGIIFGTILSEAGATEAIAKGFLKRTGTKHAAFAVAISGFLISIPVYMDAAFVIMIPIVKYVADATKKSIMVYVVALGVGTIVGHTLIIPTPGPLAVATNVNANVGGFLFYSLIAGFVAILVGGWLYGKRFRKYSPYSMVSEEVGKVEKVVEGPSFGRSLMVLLIPILLILIANVVTSITAVDSALYNIAFFIGNKDVALFLGCIFAVVLLRKYMQKSFNSIVISAADSAGLILLVTGAGGAFGNVLSVSGIGDYLVTTMTDLNISPLILGFLLSALLRVSQGSATVALVTTSAIIGPSLAATGVSPILAGLAICAGGVGLSLPNDSGFWVLSRFSNISVSDTLKSWSIGGTIAGVSVFIVVLLLSLLNDLIGLPFL